MPRVSDNKKPESRSKVRSLLDAVVRPLLAKFFQLKKRVRTLDRIIQQQEKEKASNNVCVIERKRTRSSSAEGSLAIGDSTSSNKRKKGSLDPK
jgi:hypothetical protein